MKRRKCMAVFTALAVALQVASGPVDIKADTYSAPEGWILVEDDQGIRTGSGWYEEKNNGCSGEHAWQTHTPKDSVSYTFTGTGVRWIGQKDINFGSAKIYIDGEEVTTVSTVSPGGNPMMQNLYTIVDMPDQEHTIKIEAIGPKLMTSGGDKQNVIEFDALAYTSKEIKADAITVDESEITLMKGGNQRIRARVTAMNGTAEVYKASDKITYSSNQDAVASVDAFGVVTAIAKGTAEITVKAGNMEKKIAVNVKEPLIGSEMRMTVDNQHPLIIHHMARETDAMKKIYDAPIQGGHTIPGFWEQIPEKQKPYSAIVIHAGDYLDSNKPYYDSFNEPQMDIAEANKIPFFLMVGNSFTSSFLPNEKLIAYFEKYEYFRGPAYSELHSTKDYNKLSTDIAKKLEISAQYGGMVWVADMNDKNDSVEQILNNRKFYETAKAYKKNLILLSKTTSAWEPSQVGYNSHQSVTYGAWLSDYCDNYGSLIDSWMWFIERYGKLYGGTQIYKDWPEECRGAFGMPELLYPIRMIDEAMNGATVYSFEHPFNSTGVRNQLNPTYIHAISKAIDYMIDSRIPTKEEMLKKTKIAYDSTQGTLSSFQSKYSFIGSLYGDSGKKGDAKSLLTRTTGRYGIVPSISKLAAEAFKTANPSVTMITKNDARNQAQMKDFFDREFTKQYDGTGFAQKLDNTWYTYNTLWLKQGKQYATLPLNEKNTKKENKTVTVTYDNFTYVLLEEKDGSIDVRLNNFLVNKDDIWEGYNTYDDESHWDSDNKDLWIQYMLKNYYPDQTRKDNDYRTTTIQLSDQIGAPEIKITSEMMDTFRNMPQHEKPVITFDETTRTASITIKSNGWLDFTINPANKDALGQAIQEAEKLVLAEFQDGSLKNAFIKALSDAKDAYQKDVLKKEADEKRSMLLASMKALKDGVSADPIHVETEIKNVAGSSQVTIMAKSVDGNYKPYTPQEFGGNPDPKVQNKAVLTDGITNNQNAYYEFGCEDKGKEQGKRSMYIQMQLDEAYALNDVQMWRYYDNRQYDATIVAVSETEDFSEALVVYNSDNNNVHQFFQKHPNATRLDKKPNTEYDNKYPETAAGKTFGAKDATAKYVRVYVYGLYKSANGQLSDSSNNHIIDIQVNANVPKEIELENPLKNADNKLNLLAPETNDQVVHPDVVVFEKPWKGYRYWMGYTPNGVGGSLHENPSIAASHDGENWEIPQGLTNPVQPRFDEHKNQDGWEHNCDTDLVYDPVGDRLILYWEWVRDNGKPSDESEIRCRVSYDGINWGKPIEGKREVTTGDQAYIVALSTKNVPYRYSDLSPTVVYNTKTQEFELWANDAKGSYDFSQKARVWRLTSKDPLCFSKETDINKQGRQEVNSFLGKDENGHQLAPWHLDIQWIPELGEYWGMVQAFDSTQNPNTSSLRFTKSKNGIDWEPLTDAKNQNLSKALLKPGAAGKWDDGQIYRTTFWYEPSKGLAKNEGTVHVWYSAISSGSRGPKLWYIGYTSALYRDIMEYLTGTRPEIGPAKAELKNTVAATERILESPDMEGNWVFWNDMDRALKNAKNILEDPDALETQIEEAVAQLKTVTSKLTSVNKVRGHSLVLDGTLGVNFYATLTEEVIKNPDAYVVLSCDGKDTKVMVREAVAGKTTKVKDGEVEYDCYRFTVRIAAKQMAKKITVRLYNNKADKNPILLGVYALKDYADSKKVAEDEKLKTLVDSMLNYGGYAQKYFKYDMENLPAKLSDVTHVTIPDNYAMQLTEKASDKFKYYGSSLVLESGTAMRIYFSITDKDFDLTKVTVTKGKIARHSDTLFYVEIPDIAAKDLGIMHDVTVRYNEVDQSTVKMSAISYAKKQIDDASTKEELKSLLKALYQYYTTVVTYNAGKK